MNRASPISSQEETIMWTKPKLVEVAVGTEINAYACAEIG
jgi:coenzyme PQQ precursor peptide PqqA